MEGARKGSGSEVGMRGRSIRALRWLPGPGVLVLTGCLASVHSPMQSGPRPDGPTPMLAGQNLSSRPDEVLVKPFEGGDFKGYEVLDVRMPSAGWNGQPGNQIAARYYRALGAGRRALVVVVPAWGNAPYPANTLRRHVLKGRMTGDVDVLQVLGEESMFDWQALRAAEDPAALKRVVERDVRSFQTTVGDIRGLVAWAQRSFELEPRRTAIVGYSLGGSAAIQVMALEPAMAAGVFIFPAAALHEVMASCGNTVRRSRRQILERQGWTVDELKDWSEDPLRPIDPLLFVRAIPVDRVLLIEAARDQCVSETARDSLWRGLGRPERITIDGGHRTSFLKLTPMGLHQTTRDIVRFLEDRLGGERETAAGGVQVAGSR